MPVYAYAAIDSAGKTRNGTVEATDQKSAVSRVAAEGRYVTEIKEQDSLAVPQTQSEEYKRGGKPNRSDIALFTRRLGDLASSGLPLDRVLAVLSQQTENQQLSDAIAQCLLDVQGGLPLSAALAKHDRFFPDVYTMTLRAGEASGQLPQSAERLADLLENEVKRSAQVISALIYPAILCMTAVFVVVFLLTFVVPKLSSVFEGLADELPISTKILLAVTGFLTKDWLQTIVGIVVVVGGSMIYLRTEGGKLARDKFYLRAPVIGPTMKKAVVSRYARVLGTLVFGGVPILEALELSGLAAGNRVFKNSTQFVEDEVREGRSIAVAMKEAGVFPPVLTHMVAIGEETGDLSRMLERVSNSLDFEVENSLKRLTTAVEPIIVLVMGAFVAFIVISVMLPIFQAQDLVK